jgi:hypothetical protein
MPVLVVYLPLMMRHPVGRASVLLQASMKSTGKSVSSLMTSFTQRYQDILYTSDPEKERAEG